EGRCGTCLAGEARDGLARGDLVHTQHLDGDALIEEQVATFVHRAHSTDAEEAIDAVLPADHRTRGDRRRRRSSSRSLTVAGDRAHRGSRLIAAVAAATVAAAALVVLVAC